MARKSPPKPPSERRTMQRLDDDEGWLYRGTRIVRRYGGVGPGRGFWMLDDPADEGQRYYSLPDAKQGVDSLVRRRSTT